MAYEGLSARAPEASEFGSLLEMVDGVFRAEGGSMAAEFPRLLSETNRANLRVVVVGGEVVSHAGVIIRDASVSGLRVRVALMGAVGTAEEARGKGYATECVRAACERSVEDGADFMVISGGRGLYRRLGARSVGADTEMSITADQARSLERDGIEVRSFGEEHLLEAVDLYSAEEVRLIRPLEDWLGVLRSGLAWCGKVTFLGAWEAGRLAACAAVHPPGEESESFVVEYAGARGVLLGGLSRMMEYVGAEGFRLHLGHQDAVLGSRLAARGIKGKAVPADGTRLVLNFESLMDRLRARFLERSGESASRELSFSEEGPPLGPGNSFRIACGPDVVTIEGRGALAEFVFGTPGARPCGARPGTVKGATSCAEEAPCVKLYGAGGPFRAAFPVPSPWSGLNFT